MKLKKLVSAVAGVVMACVFATSAFAANAGPEQVAAAKSFLADFGITYEVTPEEIDQVLAVYGTPEKVKEKVSEVITAVRDDSENAQAIVDEALKGTGISVQVSGVSIVDGNVKATVTINGKTYTATATTAGTPAAVDGAVDSTTSNNASSVTNSGNVIKATGDASAVVLVAGVLAVAAVLGLAVRKNSSIG